MVDTAFVWPVRVYWEDTDAGGVVYYANYWKFLERARSEWLRGLGVEQTDLAVQDGVMFAVRQVQADYLAPARFNDLLEVECRILEVRRASLVLQQDLRRGPEHLFAARVRLACVATGSFRPAKIPDQLLQRIDR